MLKLLVVMVLPALPVLLVALARVGIRMESRRRQRQNNLQQPRAGMQRFTQDHEDRFSATSLPQTGTWPGCTALVTKYNLD